MSQQPDASFYDTIEQKFGHPKAIWFLFATEMWERFSYYGMRAILVLYMLDSFVFSDDKAYGIYGAYVALVYLTPVFGGILADRILGFRKGVTVGAVFMAAGHFCMAFSAQPMFFLALALLIVGNGFFKPNMSTIVGRLYAPGDERRDSGYTIFYTSVNVGSTLATVACPVVAKVYGYHWGFSLAGFGMLSGLIVFLASQKYLKGIADPPDEEKLRRPFIAGISREWVVYAGGAAMVGLAWVLVQQQQFVSLALQVFAFLTLTALFVFSLTRLKIERERLWVLMILLTFTVVFWAFFEQAGTSLTVFADRNLDRNVLGVELPAAMMQFLNPLFIVIFAPLFAWLWIALSKRKLNPSTPLKFGLGLIQLGLGYVALYYGCISNGGDGVVPIVWIVLGYLLHTTGEICLSPVGLSMVSKLAPPEMGAMVMGIWYLAFSVANIVGAAVARMTAVDTTELVTAADTVMVYGGVFGKLAAVAVGTGLFLAVLAPLLRRLMHGIR